MREARNRLSPRGKVIVVTIGVLFFSLLTGGCSSPEEEGDTSASETTIPQTSTAEGQQETACLKVGPALVRGIAEGLTTEKKGALRFASAVKSDDPQGYLISADIQAPGLEGKNDVATWSLGDLQQTRDIQLAMGNGLIFAVDAVAREFSSWGAAMAEGSPAADLRQAFQDSPAFEQSRDCVSR